METRNKTEFKIYLLCLNMMRDRPESYQCVAISDDRQKLIDWYDSLQTEPYPETVPEFAGSRVYTKVFQKNSALEWFNPLDTFEINQFGQGIQEKWVNTEELRYLVSNNFSLIDSHAQDNAI